MPLLCWVALELLVASSLYGVFFPCVGVSSAHAVGSQCVCVCAHSLLLVARERPSPPLIAPSLEVRTSPTLSRALSTMLEPLALWPSKRGVSNAKWFLQTKTQSKAPGSQSKWFMSLRVISSWVAMGRVAGNCWNGQVCSYWQSSSKNLLINTFVFLKPPTPLGIARWKFFTSFSWEAQIKPSLLDMVLCVIV